LALSRHKELMAIAVQKGEILDATVLELDKLK
jgi:hypothetical protein